MNFENEPIKLVCLSAFEISGHSNYNNIFFCLCLRAHTPCYLVCSISGWFWHHFQHFHVALHKKCSLLFCWRKFAYNLIKVTVKLLYQIKIFELPTGNFPMFLTYLSFCRKLLTSNMLLKYVRTSWLKSAKKMWTCRRQVLSWEGNLTIHYLLHVPGSSWLPW